MGTAIEVFNTIGSDSVTSDNCAYIYPWETVWPWHQEYRWPYTGTITTSSHSEGGTLMDKRGRALNVAIKLWECDKWMPSEDGESDIRQFIDLVLEIEKSL